MTNNKTLKVLIIGYGSIGKRHKTVCEQLGYFVHVVSAHSKESKFFFSSIKDGLNNFDPNYVVISNDTFKHLETIKELKSLNFNGNILIEKPIFASFSDVSMTNFKCVKVAYNLRFHPLVQKLKDLLNGQSIISSYFYIGQHLSEWRPNRDYRDVYSASREKGGGVLLDLSHDLDLILYLLGDYKRLTAIGGKYSSLDISSDDIYGLLIKTEACPVISIQLNYLDRRAKRKILINTNYHTFEADLISGELYIDKELVKFDLDYDVSYRIMHECMMREQFETLCDYNEGMKILNVVEKSIFANEKEVWVNI
jgi:predicted dehydrogenase